MQTNIRTPIGLFRLASVALMGAMGSARAADDKWFVLGQTTIKSTDPSASIKSEGSRWDKDVKQVKLSVEGADMQVANVVLHWDDREDDAFDQCRRRQVGGTNCCEGCSRIKARLTSVTVQYKILGGAPSANVRLGI